MKKFISILTVLLFVFGFSANLVMAATTPVATLTTVAGGITSISGAVSTTGTEVGVHTITISDATASTITSNDIEDNGAADTIAVTIDGTNDDVTIIIAGKTLTFDLAAATGGVTTLAAVAADLQTKINAALIAQDMPVTVAVTVVGVSPAKTLLITVGKAGLSNTITSINGGGATALTFLNAPVASTDAKAVDVFVAGTGSNGLWVAANPGSTKTVSHTTTPGTASTLAGLKTLITAANAFINGITLVAAGDVSAGAPEVTITAGDAHHFKVTAASATPTAGGTDEITITAYDDSENRATGYAGAKTLIFSGLSAAATAEIATVEAVELGSDTAINFTSGVSDGGVATLIAYKAETASLDVAEKTPGTISSTGNAAYNVDLTVAAAAANKLVFAVQPSSINYRAQNFLTQPQVRIQDVYGNNRTDTGTSIALAEKITADCSGVVNPAGTLTGTPDDTASGLTSFTTVQFDTTSGGATYYLAATSAGLVSACSTGFTVVSGSSSSPVASTYTATTTTTTTPAAETTTTTTVPAVTSMPLPVKPITEMNQTEKNDYTMSLQQFLIKLLVQLLELIKAQKGL